MKKEKQAVVPCYYYILKVICDSGKRTYYKIGNATKQERWEQLISDYTYHGDNTVTVLTYGVLPHNNKKRLSDSTIRAYLDKNLFNPIDQKTIEGCLHTKDGYTEFVECLDTTLTDSDIINKIKDTIKSLDSNKYFTINNKFDKELDYSKDSRHLVGSRLLDDIIDKFNCVNHKLYNDVCNYVLLIGQFDFDFIASIACHHNVYILHDTKEQKHTYTFEKINEKIRYIDTPNEIISIAEELKLMGKKFDLVISNPPYGKDGADITLNVIQNVKPDEFVNLMPQNDYTRAKGLINYVNLDTLERVDNYFEDAIVIPWIAKINTTPDMNMTEEDFTIVTCEKVLQKFYHNNLNKSHYAIDTIIYGDNPSKKTAYNTDKDFLITWRTYVDGVHKDRTSAKRGLDIKWNLEKSVSLKDVHVSDNNQYTCSFIRFNSNLEKDNFTNFWYNGKLMNILIKGMNRNSGLLTFTFPKVDWTRPWTDEEILKEFGYTEEEIKEVLK